MVRALKFFTFNQNNSGGSFTFDAERGISTVVIVQAVDWQEANYRAGRIGLYFDGYGDCRCCGDRWSEQWGVEGTDTPTVYGASIAEWVADKYFTKWQAPSEPEAFIHFADGRIMGVGYIDATSPTRRVSVNRPPELGQ
jgi:hypothetical protein